ncbi:MAG: CCA tRNA nucleotidyltransferase [Anaerolineales bacterium]
MLALLPDENPFAQPYAGRWVACVDGRIVAQGGTPQQAQAAAQRSRNKEQLQIRYIPLMTTLPFSPLFNRICAVLPTDVPVYLVGGAVRDALRGRTSHDLDFVVQGNARTMARQVGDALEAAYYPLHDDFDAGRVVLQDVDGRLVIDFIGLHPDGLEADLRARDFTLNAIAVDVRNPQQLLDPLGGAADLRRGILRVCSPASLRNDPVRILRAVRMAVNMDLQIAPETRRLIQDALPGLPRVSIERVRSEILRILGGARPAVALRTLDVLGVLPAIFPETTALKGVVQSPPHIYPVWEHTLDVVARLDAVLNVLGTGEQARSSADNLVLGHVSLRLGRYREHITHHLAAELTPDISRRALLFFAALYHDSAKPLTRSQDEDGRIRFFGHDAQGADLVSARAHAMHMSSDEISILKRIVANHMRPLLLGQGAESPGDRAVYRFFRDAGDAGVDVCLLSLADFLGTYGAGVPQDAWAHHVDTVRILLDGWWARPERVVLPTPLLNGHDIIEIFGLSPGPQIGALLEALREAQAGGEVSDRAQALAFLQSQVDRQA